LAEQERNAGKTTAPNSSARDLQPVGFGRSAAERLRAKGYGDL